MSWLPEGLPRLNLSGPASEVSTVGETIRSFQRATICQNIAVLPLEVVVSDAGPPLISTHGTCVLQEFSNKELEVCLMLSDHRQKRQTGGTSQPLNAPLEEQFGNIDPPEEQDVLVCSPNLNIKPVEEQPVSVCSPNLNIKPVEEQPVSVCSPNLNIKPVEEQPVFVCSQFEYQTSRTSGIGMFSSFLISNQ
jgi:hypothetical protein